MDIQIRDNGQITKVGNADLDNGVYYSYRKEKMNKFNGFAISKQILDYLKSMAVNKVVVSGLSAHTIDFYEHGSEWNDRGDLQLVLNLNFFENNGI